MTQLQRATLAAISRVARLDAMPVTVANIRGGRGFQRLAHHRASPDSFLVKNGATSMTIW